MIAPPVTVTQRERTAVTLTRPTFCVWKRVEDSADQGADAVGAQAPGERVTIDSFAGDFSERQKHPERFDHHHDHYDAHGDDGDKLKLRQPEMQRQHDRSPGRGEHFFEMHDSQHAGQQRACDDAEQHRDVGDEAGAPLDQAENHEQHEQRNAQSLQLAVTGIWKGALNSIDHLGQGR